MKKLIVVAVAVALAAMSQAAQVTWTASAIAQSGESTSYYAMIVDAAGITGATSASVVEAIIKDTFTGTVIYEGDATYNASKAQVAVAFAKKTVMNGSYGSGSEVEYMTILFDAATPDAAKNYMVTSGDTPVTAHFSDASLLAVPQGSQAGKTWTAVPGSSVPEPTSGLLMLLGVAGLALRRRRA